MSYDRRQVEALLPAVWDDAYLIHGLQREEVRDPEMPSGSAPDPRRTNGHVCAIADVKRAFDEADLTKRMRQSLLLAYGMDEPRASIARLLGVSKRTVQYDCEFGVGRLVAWLNGEDGYDEEEAA